MSKKIVLYNKSFDMTDDRIYFNIEEGFDLSNDHHHLDDAVAVIFHIPTLGYGDKMLFERKKRQHQLWVFWSQECEQNFEWQYRPEILGLFDIFATYRLDCDIPVPYFGPGYLGKMKRAPVAKTGFINAFLSSNCNLSRRLEYFSELMAYIPIDSYGTKFNNKSIDNDEGSSTKEKIIAAYKFTIAFENSIATDYVTEKFFTPLIIGSVPVYLGAPNIDEFSPGDSCYINVSSFPSPRELAKYLIELSNDQGLYEQYMSWKDHPLKKDFVSKVNSIQKSPLKRLCDMIRERIPC